MSIKQQQRWESEKEKKSFLINFFTAKQQFFLIKWIIKIIHHSSHSDCRRRNRFQNLFASCYRSSSFHSMNQESTLEISFSNKENFFASWKFSFLPRGDILLLKKVCESQLRRLITCSPLCIEEMQWSLIY